jgi:hypothetical protein
MKIICKRCNTEISVENINLENFLAKCSNCETIFSIRHEVEDFDPDGYDKVPINLPSHMQISQGGENLVIKRRWWQWHMKYIHLFLITIMWNGLAIDFYAEELFNLQWGLSILDCAFIIVGFGFLYASLAFIFNSTTITVNTKELTSRHHPFPWYGGERFSAQQIEQLYCRPFVFHRDNFVDEYYQVYIVTRDGTEKHLIGPLEVAEQAFFIEQEIERYLQITDRLVYGEIIR